MRKYLRGFTVVELIVIITVIGIISAIAFISWNTVLGDARDKARESDTNLWISTFEAYKARYTVWPVVPDTLTGSLSAKTICLGDFSGYSNKCGQYGSAVLTQYIAASGADFTAVSTESAKVGDVPVNSGPSVNSLLTGPLVYMTRDSATFPITVTALFFNFFERGCPNNWTRYYTAPTAPSLPAPIALTLSGSATAAFACAKTATLTITG